MRVVNENFETITEYDLSKGQLVNTLAIKENVLPIDNVNKFAYCDEDYEEAKMFIPFTEDTEIPSHEQRLQALESAMLAMMSGGMRNV